MTWLAIIGRWLISPLGRAFLLMAALLGALWWFRSSTWDRATEAERDRNLAAVAAAQREQRAAEIARDNLANAIADTTAERARQASQEEQGRTTATAERVRVVTRTIQASCPVRVPDEAWGELNDMVSRANEATGNRKQRRAR
jgi:hypothetical protein